MASRLKKLSAEDFEALYRIVVSEEPFGETVSFEHLKMRMKGRDGWTLWNGEELIGALTLFDLQPLLNMSIHVMIDRNMHRRWINREILRQMFCYAFGDLELRRLSSHWIPGLTDDAAILLASLGFRIEGTVRKGFRDPYGNFWDVVIFGMLAEECKWL